MGVEKQKAIFAIQHSNSSISISMKAPNSHTDAKLDAELCVHEPYIL